MSGPSKNKVMAALFGAVPTLPPEGRVAVMRAMDSAV